MTMRPGVHAFCRIIRRGWLVLAIFLGLFGPLSAAAVDQLHIVSRAPGNVAEHYFWNGAQFQGWNVIGGKTIVSPPALVSYQGNVHLFGVADDQRLYHAVWNGATWSGWFDFGGPFSATGTAIGAAAVDYFGYLILVAVTPDNRLLYTYFDPSTGKWQNYAELATNVFGRPAMAIHNGNLHFLVRGEDRYYYHNVYDGQTLSPFVSIGGPFASGGAMVSFGGQLHIFGESDDGELFQVVQLQQFINRGAPPGTLMRSSPAAANFADAVLVVLVRGANSGLYARTFSGGVWSAYGPSFGQSLTGPGITFHRTGGGGGGGVGPNHPPVLRELRASRTVMSFGKDPAFRTGVGGQPGFNDPVLKAAVTPRIISINTKVDAEFTLADHAAGKLPSCCTLLVAEGASDPDGDPIVFHWQAAEGTFYSTGDEGSGGFPYGAAITDITKYNRNSVFFEPPGFLPFPVVDHVLQGGESSVGVYVTDVRSSPTDVLTSEHKSVVVEWDREIHLEIRFVEGRRLPPNDPYNPGGIAMYYFLSLKGDFEVAMDVVFRIDCGANRRVVNRTIQDQALIGGALIACYYDKAEEGLSRMVTAVASVGFASSGPFAFPLSLQTSSLNFFRTLGCTAADTESQIVRVTISNELTIDVFDDGQAHDDVFDLIVDGVNIGRTPSGGDKLFDVSYLISGQHEACVRVVKSPVNLGSLRIALHGGVNNKPMTFTDGTTAKSELAPEGAVVCFKFTVPFP